MVPSAFVPLRALPRTAGGKLDRAALPAPSNGRAESDRPCVEPRTPLEEYLAGLWRDAVGVERVGVEDDFFDLGGSSIQAAVLINRVREKLGDHVSTVALFDSPTVAGLARHLGQACPDAVREAFGASALGEETILSSSLPTAHCPLPTDLVVPLQPEGSRPPCFMVHPPGGIVVCYRALARHLGREQPFYGIRSRGLHDLHNVPDHLEDMAAEYVQAIRSVQPEGPYRLGGWSLGGVVALEMAQQLLAQGQSVALLALLDTSLPSGADNSGQEYGLDLTLEELDRLAPDEQLPYLWEHVRKLGLIEEDTPRPVVQQL